MPRVAAVEPVGRRVVVRRSLPGAGGRSGAAGRPAAGGPRRQPRYADVVGVLVAAGPSTLSIRRRDGSVVEVPRSAVAALKPVLASPADVLALEEVAALGWPAPETRWLGRWLLRAAAGWTGRANSVLPLGDPGCPAEQALAEVLDWYAARGLPGRMVIPTPAREALDGALAERGWTAYNPTRVLTADLEVSLRTLPRRTDLPPVQVEPAPAEDWLAAYHYRGGSHLPPVARSILTGAADPGFAVVRSGGAAVAIARASVDRGWVGVTAVEVDPRHRRRGLATQIMRGVLEWAAGRGASEAYLQVGEENSAALALYDRLGFGPHHRYHYRLAPG
jgi:N-acetylglutamate synthase